MRSAAEAEAAVADIEGKEGKEVPETKPSLVDRMTVHEVPADASYTLPYHYTLWAVTALKKQVVRGLFFEVHTNAVVGHADVQERLDRAEVFPAETEKVYQFLQVPLGDANRVKI